MQSRRLLLHHTTSKKRFHSRVELILSHRVQLKILRLGVISSIRWVLSQNVSICVRMPSVVFTIQSQNILGSSFEHVKLMWQFLRFVSSLLTTKLAFQTIYPFPLRHLFRLSPSCSDQPNCRLYQPCYNIWWKFQDTIGPANFFQYTSQIETFYDKESLVDILFDPANEAFGYQLFNHHFDTWVILWFHSLLDKRRNWNCVH